VILDHKAWLARLDTKYAAYRIYWKAVKDGVLVRPDTCSRCGRRPKGAVEGHHADYSKPLVVEWVCKSCHAAIHVADQKATYRSRPRCDACGRVVYVHLISSGSALEIEPGVMVHKACRRKASRKRLLAVAAKYLPEQKEGAA
jgi:ribosomal protein S27AE